MFVHTGEKPRTGERPYVPIKLTIEKCSINSLLIVLRVLVVMSTSNTAKLPMLPRTRIITIRRMVYHVFSIRPWGWTMVIGQ